MRLPRLRRAIPGVVAALCAAQSPREVTAEGWLRKGPWLMDLRPTGVVVMAERRVAGPMEVRAVPLLANDGGVGREVTVRASQAFTLHELPLEGLRPGTRYRYTVSGAGIPDVSGTFGTPPLEPAPFRFVIYGDTRTQASTHRAVIEAIRRDAPEFVIHTGDLVEDGRHEDDWQEFFEIEAPLLRDTVFVPVIGNHEIIQPMSNGIENYRRYVHVAVQPGAPTGELDGTFQYANARFILANSFDDWSGPARTWLQRELVRARQEGPDDWLVVVMHWGPRSSGPHGDNDMLRENGVDAMLRDQHVDLVIAGHDHDYERGDDDGLRYIVSGGGGAPLYYREAERRATRSFAAEHHFIRVDVDRDHMSFVTMRPNGAVLDRAVLDHRGWQTSAATPEPSRAPVIAPNTGNVPPPTRDDFVEMLKFAPLGALVVALGWWARRRARREDAPPDHDA